MMMMMLMMMMIMMMMMMMMMMMIMNKQLPAMTIKTMTLVCIAGIHRKRKEGFVGVRTEEVPFVC